MLRRLMLLLGTVARAARSVWVVATCLHEWETEVIPGVQGGPLFRRRCPLCGCEAVGYG